jgi:heme a synthase
VSRHPSDSPFVSSQTTSEVFLEDTNATRGPLRSTIQRARAFRLSPAAYRRVTLAALIALGVIIVTGAAVRLTGSGLGCPDWPTCEEGRFVAPLESHAMVEWVNRMITGIVSVAVMLAVAGALIRNPRRSDLTWLATGLVGGVVAQIVLGGITVLTDLHPAAVQAHFVLSMLIVWDAVVLNHRAGQPDGATSDRVVSTGVARLSVAVVALTGAAIVAGTVVTGSGPHGGDEEARRFDFAITTVARIHGVTVMVLLAATLALLYLAVHRRQAPTAVAHAGELFLLFGVLQAAVGYVQYFNDVPELLVGGHVLGSVLVWVAALRLELSTRAPSVEHRGVLGFDVPLLEVDHLDEDAVERERVS